MAKGPKGFSDAEKILLRQQLCSVCEQSWAQLGYKRTKISELTKSIGIATGSFYLLFRSKEELFCETFILSQERLRDKWQQTIRSKPNKEGFKKAMRWLYQEYSKYPFLYNFAGSDYTALLNRMPEEKKQTFQADSIAFFDVMAESEGLQLRIPQVRAYSILATLLYTVSFAEESIHDHFEVFDFLLDCTINQIFE